MDIFYFIIFVFLVFSVYFLVHYFVYFRIVNDLDLCIQIRRFLKISFIIFALSFFIDKFFKKHAFLFPVAFFGSLWLGIISIAFTTFILEFFLIMIFPNLSRKAALAAIFLTFFISGFSVYKAALSPYIKQIDIPIEGLPDKLTGFNIIQLSDLHLDGWKSNKWLKTIVESTNKLDPDVIVITGDLIEKGINHLQSYPEILKGLKSQYGVYAILGNHEYYAGIDNFMEFSRRSNIRVLRNELLTINSTIKILGAEDNVRMLSKILPDINQDKKRENFNKPLILLTHRPKYFKEAVDFGVDLQLSGHTHAGQIPPLDLIVHLIYKYPYGLYQYKSSFIYTTCGTGFWGPPMRLFTRAEIVNIKLVPKS